MPKGKANGGCSGLDPCLWHLNFGSIDLYRSKRLRSKYEVSKGLGSTRELLAPGQSGIQTIRAG